MTRKIEPAGRKDSLDEPPERLAARALEGVSVGITSLRRLRRRLARWLRPGGKIDAARAIAALAAVQTALATISPIHLKKLARRLKRERRAG